MNEQNTNTVSTTRATSVKEAVRRTMDRYDGRCMYSKEARNYLYNELVYLMGKNGER